MDDGVTNTGMPTGTPPQETKKKSHLATYIAALVLLIMVIAVVSAYVHPNGNPIASLLHGLLGQHGNGNQTINASTSSASTSIAYSTTVMQNQTTIPSNTQTTTVNATTTVSNTVNSTSTTTISTKPQPLTVGNAIANPINPSSGTTVILSAAKASGGYGLISYQWLMKTPSNSSYVKLAGATTNQTSFLFAGVPYGNYIFMLNVMDGSGNTTNSVPVTVNYNANAVINAHASIIFNTSVLTNISPYNAVIILSNSIIPGNTYLTASQLPYVFTTNIVPMNLTYYYVTPLYNMSGGNYILYALYTPTCKNTTSVSSRTTNSFGTIRITGNVSNCTFFGLYN
jgi:hypothetical protein